MCTPADIGHSSDGEVALVVLGVLAMLWAVVMLIEWYKGR